MTIEWQYLKKILKLTTNYIITADKMRIKKVGILKIYNLPE